MDAKGSHERFGTVALDATDDRGNIRDAQLESCSNRFASASVTTISRACLSVLEGRKFGHPIVGGLRRMPVRATRRAGPEAADDALGSPGDLGVVGA